MKYINFVNSLTNIFDIMKKDFRSSFKNPIVVVVLMAIIILPSLYALLNIQACWDPYGNTGELPFAIANLDEGSTYANENITVGNDLVEELKNNTDFKWTFVSEEELREGVYNGTYYAGIIIPKNCSQNVVSITTDTPESAHLEYIVNRKTNPMASKLSDTAAKAIYNKMNAKIVEFINVAAYGKLGDLQGSLAAGASEMSYGAVQLEGGASQVSNGAGQVSAGAGELSSGAGKLSNGANELSTGATQLSQASQRVSEGSSQVQQASSQLQSSVDVDKLPDGDVKNVVKGSVELANSSSQVAQGSSQVAAGSSEIANKSVELAGGASKLADGANALAEGSLSLAAGSELLANSAASALISAASSLSGASVSLSDVTGVDEDQIGEYFYSPVKLDEHELFEMPNYASEVAPFYIVLSMWVGAVITTVMLRPGISEGTKYSPVEMYFGKLTLFTILSILQATVTIIGALWLGLKIDNLSVFILSAYFISVLFMTIMYSLVSALGQVGKGIGVILLVLQISGTGGIYPIGLMDTFFQMLYPYMPMTHAITLIRESALGLVWSNYLPSLEFLVILGLATVIIATVVKQRADRVSHYFEKRLEETDLF